MAAVGGVAAGGKKIFDQPLNQRYIEIKDNESFPSARGDSLPECM
jgi:hypothetical protein